LCAGTGVVDVAGGRGMLSFELCQMRGVPCSVVDPRLADGVTGRRLTLEQAAFVQAAEANGETLLQPQLFAAVRAVDRAQKLTDRSARSAPLTKNNKKPAERLLRCWNHHCGSQRHQRHQRLTGRGGPQRLRWAKCAPKAVQMGWRPVHHRY
jgi:hypothetical protein